MSSPDSPPVEQWRYRTTDAEQGTEVLRALYTDHTPSFAGDPGAFELRLDSDVLVTASGRLSIDRVRHTMRTTARAEPTPRLTVVATSGGWMRFRCGRDEAASVALAPTTAPFAVEWEDLANTTGQIDITGVQRTGAELAGIDPAAVRFTGMNPMSDGLGRYVAAVLQHLKDDVLPNTEAMASPLARGQAFRQLATALLMAFPNTTQTLQPAAVGVRAEPATVRRAVEFIESNAHLDIGLTDIAEVARVGVRSLQLAFRRHRDTTPLAFLKQVRMARAHHDLQLADPTAGDTVAAIAARWGFAQPGAFSVGYRRLYGRSPSETLRS